jgi:hypothetical protein
LKRRPARHPCMHSPLQRSMISFCSATEGWSGGPAAHPRQMGASIVSITAALLTGPKLTASIVSWPQRSAPRSSRAFGQCRPDRARDRADAARTPANGRRRHDQKQLGHYLWIQFHGLSRQTRARDAAVRPRPEPCDRNATAAGGDGFKANATDGGSGVAARAAYAGGGIRPSRLAMTLSTMRLGR